MHRQRSPRMGWMRAAGDGELGSSIPEGKGNTAPTCCEGSHHRIQAMRIQSARVHVSSKLAYSVAGTSSVEPDISDLEGDSGPSDDGAGPTPPPQHPPPVPTPTPAPSARDESAAPAEAPDAGHDASLAAKRPSAAPAAPATHGDATRGGEARWGSTASGTASGAHVAAGCPRGGHSP